jgi:hypothetical protein
VIDRLKEPLEFFGYFKTKKHSHKYTRFDRPEGFEDCETNLGPKYKVHNKTVLNRVTKQTQKDMESQVLEIKGYPLFPKYDSTNLVFSEGYKKIKDPYFPKSNKKDQ